MTEGFLDKGTAHYRWEGAQEGEGCLNMKTWPCALCHTAGIIVTAWESGPRGALRTSHGMPGCTEGSLETRGSALYFSERRVKISSTPGLGIHPKLNPQQSWVHRKAAEHGRRQDHGSGPSHPLQPLQS